MSNSINTNVAAYYAQANITAASNSASSSVARLSSGNRIVQASDDVAALATGTSLQTEVSALKTAQTNVSQGSSLLQVADGALAQIQSILQQMKSVALQAGSGSLTDTDRGFLNQQFQALSSQIDTLSAGTSFNGVALLDGSLAQAAGISGSTTQSAQAGASISLSSNLVAGDAIAINGITFTATTGAGVISSSGGVITSGTFQIGATTADTVNNLKTILNTAAAGVGAAALGAATYATGPNGQDVPGSATLYLTAKTGGALGNNFTINASGVTTNKASVSGQYGGSTINLFKQGSGFATSTQAVVAGTSTSTAPFTTGDTLKVSVGSGGAVTLYTYAAGDSLTNIVNGINTSTGTTGIGAILVFGSNGSGGSEYNIQLQMHNSTGQVAINGGNNFYNVDNSGSQFHTLSGATTSVNLLTDNLAAAIGGGSAVGNLVTAPFQNNDNIYVSVAGGAKAALLDAGKLLATGDTLAQIITKINTSAAANALGVHAYSNSGNIGLTFSDPTQAGAISFSTGQTSTTDDTFNTDALGQNGNNGLNGSRITFNLFATGLATPDTAIAAATSTPNLPLETDSAITLKINTTAAASTSYDLLTGSAGLSTTTTLQGLAGLINSSTAAVSNGIHASVVTDSGGKYNIQLTYNTSIIPPVGTSGTGVANGVQVGITHTSTGVIPATNNITPTFSTGASSSNSTYQLFNSSFASHFTVGQQVVIASATTTVAKPISTSDNIVVNIAGVGNKTIALGASLAAGNTLSDIVNVINGNTAATKIAATLDGNGTNILLQYTGTAVVNPAIATNMGADFFDNTDLTTGVQNVTSGAANSYASVNVFSSNLTGGGYLGGATVISTATTGDSSSAQVPFVNGNTVTFTLSGASGFSTAAISIGASETIQQLVTAINSDTTAKANGLHATLIDTGAAVNIQLNYANQTNALASTFGNITVNAVTGAAGNAPTTTNITPTGTASTYHAVNNVLRNSNAVTASTVAVATGLTAASTYGLANGADTGLGYGSTSVTGAIGDSLVTGLTQKSANVTISFPDIDPAALTASGNFGSDGSKTISVGGHTFSFVTTATAADQIVIGSTLQETLDNAVSTINSYGANNATGDTAFQLNQINAARSGNTLVFTGKGISDVKALGGGVASTIAINITSASSPSNSGVLNNSSRTSGATFGVDVTGISNKDFTGTIGGFSASYTGTANTVNLSATVGAYTYTANGVATNPITGNETVRFFSSTAADGTNGGYFDVQLSNNNGQTVNSTSDATSYATRLNAAFSGLNFAQERQLSSYNGTQAIIAGGAQVGSLIGSSVKAQLGNFTATKLTNITVTAPAQAGGDAHIDLTIDGEVFQTSGIGSQLGANQTYRLTSTTNANHFVDFTTGGSAIDLSSTANALATQTALSGAFGVSNGAGALSFQVGSASTDTLSVSIGSAETSSIFNGQALTVDTQANATAANSALDDAINTVTSLRANVGALESRFNFASAALQSSVQNQDAARGQLLDTDIATESTAFATQQVKLQAGISVLAQANQQLQALLKLIG